MNDKKILIIASRNKGKIREIKEILSGIPFEIKSLVDIGLDVDIEETGKTFEENAILKAKTIGEKTRMLILGEDSGLEVDTLGGRPGIFSARYAKGSDLDRINKLLKELKGIPDEKRTARFRCVAAIYVSPSMSSPRKRGSKKIPDQVGNDKSSRIVTFDGVSEGYITDKPIGSNGFGYDPIFFNLDLGKTNAKASSEEKNRISHRARALEKCKKFFLNLR